MYMCANMYMEAIRVRIYVPSAAHRMFMCEKHAREHRDLSACFTLLIYGRLKELRVLLPNFACAEKPTLRKNCQSPILAMNYGNTFDVHLHASDIEFLELVACLPAQRRSQRRGNTMTCTKNQFGVPQYPESDARRLFVLLAAIELLERPTISAIADLTSLPRDAIEIGIRVLEQQYGVQLIHMGEVYRIESWGDVLNRDGVMRHLRG